MQGRSIRSICETGREPADWRHAVYYRYFMHMVHHWNPSHLGLRTKDRKLIYYYGCAMDGTRQTPPGWELYDLTRDPHELVNVIDDPAYAGEVRALRAELRALREDVGDTDDEFPEMRAIIDEFWDDDAADRARAIELSHEYVARERAKRKG